MPTDANILDISLLGKEYRVACPPEEKKALARAVTYLDAKMREIAEKTHNNASERIAVMAALNIAHEFLSKAPVPDLPAETGLDFDTVKSRIAQMETQLDSLLEQPDN